MTATRKPRPVADQAGRRSKDLALDNQPTAHSRRTPSNTALAVRERARTHVARQSVRLGALQVKRTASQIAGNARRAGLSPQAVALLESLEAAAADFAAVVRRPETWTEAEQ
ncbi:hypothetical protein [Actinomyces urogenitalis]|uniref:hypothetical protein n=1 Tax=Actinomyces urogenitalis TaxID=103621 RepID=UPI00254F9B2E|nr:hypothetical protein [Actinomyces urogenitalis]MDK8237906.1 hypothetical protein [Actinomyces urogenitalis]WOO94355.1 hypothetical protein R3I39_06455 [Actinomyces urogenitalis]